MLCVSDALSKGLLLRYMWNKDRLIEDFLNKPDLIEDLFQYPNPKCPPSDMSNPYLCPVCYCDTDETLAMECGHRFCKECY